MKRILIIVGVFLAASVAFFYGIESAQAAPVILQTDVVQLHPIDGSGIYALPDGAKVASILLNGKPTPYTIVKGGTEVDVWYSRWGTLVEAITWE
jgi:hypothetical protein